MRIMFRFTVLPKLLVHSVISLVELVEESVSTIGFLRKEHYENDRNK